EAVKAAYDAGTVTLDLLLEAQRNRADAEAAYYRSLTDYNKAIMLVHARKGSLLEYNGVFLAEGPWPAKAYFDARRRARARDAGMYMDYGVSRPAVFSEGPFPQFQDNGGGNAAGVPTEAGAEEVTTPPGQQQQPAAPGNKQELPAPSPIPGPPMPGPAANRPGARAVTSGPPARSRMPAPADSAQSDQHNSARMNGVATADSLNRGNSTPKSSTGTIRDRQVRQASAQESFDWGDLSLNDAKGPVPPKKIADSAFNDDSANGSKSSGSNESDSVQPVAADQTTSGWKRAR
ncbi:MAG: hypothetical protein ACRD9W_29965, partial [Terriglobia bacterium]